MNPKFEKAKSGRSSVIR